MPIKPLLADQFPGATAGAVPNRDSPGLYPEDNLNVPWTVNPVTSWLAYRCWVEIELDAGMALHKILPQGKADVDTLATVAIDDPLGDLAVTGPNVASKSLSVDAIQRMSSSTYKFVLKGWALRAGYQIPIPALKTVGGVPAVPEERQWGYNAIVGNFSGVPVWFATWELQYVLGRSPGPSARAPVPFNPALHIRPDAELPLAVLLPRAGTDPDAVDQQGQTSVRGIGKLQSGGL